MKKICDQKLYAEFDSFDALNIEYVEKAKGIAERIFNKEEVSIAEIAEIRLKAVMDKTHLKGDFVITVFLVMQEQMKLKELELREFKPWRGGKRLKLTEKTIRKIYRNHFVKDKTVTEFCKENRITRCKYYRVVNCDVKLVEDIFYLRALKIEVLNEMEEK